jgi:hypothetical protein
VTSATVRFMRCVVLLRGLSLTHPALGRTIASRLSRSLHAPLDILGRRTLHRARPPSILDPPDSHTSKSAAKRESCRNTSDYRTQSAKGQSVASSPVHLPKYGELPRKSPVFQTLICSMRAISARKTPKSFGDWIARHQKTARWPSSGVCRQYLPGSKRSCIQAMV